MRLRAFVAVVAILASGGSFAANIDTRVSGVIYGGDGSGNFTCYGMPTCIGTLYAKITHQGCSNTFSLTTGMQINGFDLSKPGSFAGTAFLTQTVQQVNNNPNGTCNYVLGPGDPSSYTGTWDGKSGTFFIPDPDSPLNGTFTASLPAGSPVFPMTVTGDVSTTSANVSASIQARSQDIGKTESVYVFVHAPSNLVSGAHKRVGTGSPVDAAKDDAVVCVLAQVNAGGQLVAVSASTMQAYLTGVLSTQSQAVQILNNVATPNVAGATAYVGYGTSAAAMLSSAVYQAAISLAGPVQCTASLASAPAPTSPGALTGLWWNENESGWGIHFTQRGGVLFAAWYTYDSAGKPKWYVATDCEGMTGTSGTCTGSLYEVNGPKFFGVPFTPITNSQVAVAGSFKATFTDANNGSINYTVGTLARTIPIVRQPVAVGTATPAVDYTDLWWNPDESGWGMAMAHQSANIFLAWFVYDPNGKPVWYVASACAVSGSGCSGDVYSTTGPPLGPTFDSKLVTIAAVGSIVVSFIDANNAVLSYTVNGVTASKSVTRQLF